jgi:probable F420-dependent oxidoreductase
MDFWIPWITEAGEQTRSFAKIAEKMGYVGVAVADHVAIPEGYQSIHPSGENHITLETPFLDPFTTIATMAAVTETLRFATYIYVLPMREPLMVAKQVGSLAILSDYRLVFGVGAGWLREEFELLRFPPANRGRRMDEMLCVLRQFWEQGVAEFHGEFFDIPRSGMYPKPAHRIPVWIGGKSDIGLQRAARNDGWFGMDYPLDEVERLLKKLNTERQAYLDSGHADTPFNTFVVVQEPPSHALYDKLTELGVTATLAVPWPPGDPAYEPLEAKIEAMQAFADQFITKGQL